jgi:hypothetical protein
LPLTSTLSPFGMRWRQRDQIANDLGPMHVWNEMEAHREDCCFPEPRAHVDCTYGMRRRKLDSIAAYLDTMHIWNEMEAKG